MDTVARIYVLDAVQRRITELTEQEFQEDSYERECTEQVLGILSRAEVELREELYPAEPLFPYMDDPTMTYARLGDS